MMFNIYSGLESKSISRLFGDVRLASGTVMLVVLGIGYVFDKFMRDGDAPCRISGRKTALLRAGRLIPTYLIFLCPAFQLLSTDVITDSSEQLPRPR